jgi:phospholipid transport system substrate-binding protein
MRRTLLTGFAAAAALAIGTAAMGAGLFSSKGPVIAIVAGELFLGEAEATLGGPGTIRIQSRAKPDLTCDGEFSFSAELGDVGTMRCSDGATAKFQFKRLSLVRGHGIGSTSRGPMSFTYGLDATESVRYLELPPDTVLRSEGKVPVLVALKQADTAGTLRTGAAAPETAPDVLLSTATAVVIANLRQHRNLHTTSSAGIAQLVEATVLPLFNFGRMTQLAVATNWRLASPAQQQALTAEFRTLLVRTYSTALASYREQTIEYQPLRMAAGETVATVRSTMRQPGAERMTLDYDLEKTVAGWKVYDVRIAGMSLVTTYRSTFAQTVRDSGVDGLISALAAKNRG